LRPLGRDSQLISNIPDGLRMAAWRDFTRKKEPEKVLLCEVVPVSGWHFRMGEAMAKQYTISNMDPTGQLKLEGRRKGIT